MGMRGFEAEACLGVLCVCCRMMSWLQERRLTHSLACWCDQAEKPVRYIAEASSVEYLNDEHKQNYFQLHALSSVLSKIAISHLLCHLYSLPLDFYQQLSI